MSNQSGEKILQNLYKDTTEYNHHIFRINYYKYTLDAGLVVFNEQWLKEALDLLQKQRSIDLAQKRWKACEETQRYIGICKELLTKIDAKKKANGDAQTANSAAQKDVEESELSKFHSFLQGLQASSRILAIVDQLNLVRLYWVWAGGLVIESLNLALEKSTNSIASNISQVQNVLQKVGNVTGTLSWGLYYFRLGIRLGLALKHIVPGSWMSEEEKALSLKTRIKIQWDKRKYPIINDLFWGISNMACFFWLTFAKGPAKGMGGNILTAGLLLMDFIISICRYKEELKKYEDEKIWIEELILGTKQEAKKMPILEDYKVNLDKLWQKKQKILLNEFVYSLSLFLSFVVMCVPVKNFSLVGAALCFFVTAINAVANYYIEISHAKSMYAYYHAQRNAYNSEIDPKISDNIQKNIPATQDSDDRIRQQRYVAMMAYHMRVILNQKMQLVRALIVDASIPALVVLPLMYLPINSAIACIVCIVAIAVAIDMLFKNKLAPTEPEPKYEVANIATSPTSRTSPT